MGATGVATAAMKNQLAKSYANASPYLTLLKALTLQSATSIGAATFSVDLSVQAGDVLVFEQGAAGQEQVTVLSVTGAGPYTVTPSTALTKSHASSAKIAHVPADATTVHELTVTRTATNWGAPSGGTLTSGASAITVSSGSGNIIGSVALMTAAATGSSTGLSSATDTITETSTAVANDDPIVFTAVGATPLALLTVYFVVSKATNSFKVSATKGGPAITLGTSTSNLSYTRGAYLDATPVNVQDLTAAGGSYLPVWVETVA
jgi:hypothetical protein